MELRHIQSSKCFLPLNIIESYERICTELASITSAYGYQLAPIAIKGINQFKSLKKIEQENIIFAIENYISQIQSALKENVDLTGDNCKHAWWSITKMGLRAPDGFFEQIKSNDIIEVYNKNSIQMFRSFEMFKYLSYSLSEIFAYDWVELYNRDELMAKRMMKLVENVLSGKIVGVIHSDFPPHVVEERFSDKKCWAKMEHSLMSALYYPDGSIGGFVSTFRILEHGRL